ncbi:MAG: ABC transporter ATP-binding protein [Phycisphaerales bacterium]|nr:ABC transporter ATP-binding protein [Phycisphaerales bacterium]
MTHDLEIDVDRSVSPSFRLRATLSVPAAGPSVTVLYGPSASGKTTLLRCIAGLERPDHGTIHLGSERWFDSRTRTWISPQGRRVGYVAQEDTLFPHLTVRGNLEYPLRSLGRAPQRTRAEELIVLFDLDAIANRRPSEISGGQRQRVALARALAPRPHLLLLDEPLSALDVVVRERVREQLRQSLVALHAPTILVTHDRSDALALGDRMAVLVDGTVRQCGLLADVFSRPADAEVARLLGVETVVEGEVVASRDGLVEVSVGDVRLIAVSDGDPGRVLVCIRAEDVVINRPGDPRGSARNFLPARIDWMRHQGALVHVGLDCGFLFTAVITRSSAEELALRIGASVAASIKAPSIHLVARKGAG